jgi:hypothetical protein
VESTGEIQEAECSFQGFRVLMIERDKPKSLAIPSHGKALTENVVRSYFKRSSSGCSRIVLGHFGEMIRLAGREDGESV